MKPQTHEYLINKVAELERENKQLKEQLASFTENQNFADNDDFTERTHQQIQNYSEANQVSYTEAMKRLGLISR